MVWVILCSLALAAQYTAGIKHCNYCVAELAVFQGDLSPTHPTDSVNPEPDSENQP
jgi:hypothetical protein